MKSLPAILRTEIVPFLTRLKPEQVIPGSKARAARMNKKFGPPYYVGGRPGRHGIPELCICRRGRMALALEKTFYLLKPNTIAFVPRNTRHYESFVTPKAGYEAIWFLFTTARDLAVAHFRYDKTGFHRLQSLKMKGNADLNRNIDIVLKKDYSWSLKKKAFARIGRLIGEELDAGRTVATILFLAEKKYDIERIHQVFDYINAHFREPITLQQVAEHISLNPYYCARLIKKITGSTYLRLLTRTRLEHACIRMLNTSRTFSEIAEECGFNDLYNFSRVFKKHFGMNPRQYRDTYIEQ